MRRCECVGLRVEDVDFDHEVLLAIIVLLAEHLLQQGIRPLTHEFSRSEHSGSGWWT